MSDVKPQTEQDKTDLVLDKIIASKILMGRLREKMRDAGYDTFINVMKHDFPFPKGEAKGRVIILDSETTDLDPDKGDLIQLSLYSVEHDGVGPVNPENVKFYSSYQDPGYDLSEETTSITGITTGDVKGQKINVAQVQAMIRDADLVVAHKADFDRKWVEAHLPHAGFKDKPWACSLSDVRWNDFGFASGGKNLTVLAMSHGYTFPAHNANADTRALTFLMGVRNGDDSPLRQLISSTMGMGHKVVAVNSPFSKKDLMKFNDHFSFNGEEDNHGIGQKAWVATLTPENAGEVADILRQVYGKDKVFPVQPSSALVRYSRRMMRSMEDAFSTTDPKGSLERIMGTFEGLAPATPSQGRLLLDEDESANTIKF